MERDGGRDGTMPITTGEFAIREVVVGVCRPLLIETVSLSRFDGRMYALLLSKTPGGTHRIAAARTRGRVQSWYAQ